MRSRSPNRSRPSRTRSGPRSPLPGASRSSSVRSHCVRAIRSRQRRGRRQIKRGYFPSRSDPRQPSLFAAAFTVGSIAALAQAGAASLTYYETVGPRGVIPGAAPLPAPGLLASPPPGGAFAMFHVFADIAETGTGVAVGASSSESTGRGGRPSRCAARAAFACWSRTSRRPLCRRRWDPFRRRDSDPDPGRRQRVGSGGRPVLLPRARGAPPSPRGWRGTPRARTFAVARLDA